MVTSEPAGGRAAFWTAASVLAEGSAWSNGTCPRVERPSEESTGFFCPGGGPSGLLISAPGTVAIAAAICLTTLALASLVIFPCRAVKTTCPEVPLWSNRSRIRSRPCWDWVPGIVNESSYSSPSAIDAPMTQANTSNQAPTTSPRCLLKSAPRR